MGRKRGEKPVRGLGKLFGVVVVTALANLDVCRLLFPMGWAARAGAAGVLLLCFVAVNLTPDWKGRNFSRLGVMLGGEILVEVSLFSLTLDLALGVYCLEVLFPRLPFVPTGWAVGMHVLDCFLFSGILALNGFIRMCATSVQLGLRRRVMLLLFWWVPVCNLFLLGRACRLVREEYAFEQEKEEWNTIRRCGETCRTRYPLVLVHGVFFRDRKCFNYWGRIPKELAANGAEIYYGGQQSAAGTEAAAAELAENIRDILRRTSCEKVNIIAHSKGGLESRWAVSRLGLAPAVASLTTVNTPHQGCAFVDWLLEKMPPWVCRWIAGRYNAALRRLGDKDPDFYEAVCDLTSRRCRELDGRMPDSPGVYCQSVGSRMGGWRAAPFPQNLTYLLVRCFDRENDGLVAVDSMKWGSRFQLVEPQGRRGVAHGDMIDLNRENIRGFDVREFYVRLVQELKERGF